MSQNKCWSSPLVTDSLYSYFLNFWKPVVILKYFSPVKLGSHLEYFIFHSTIWISHLCCIPFDEGERGERKAGLKFNIQKTKIMASDPITL